MDPRLLPFSSVINSTFIALPLAFLQVGTQLGIISALLIFRSGSIHSLPKSRWIGIWLGLSGFFVMTLVYYTSQEDFKPYVFTDFLFLAGFLGGIRNALYAGFFICLGRVVFIGPENLFFSCVDIMFIAVLSGTLQHKALKSGIIRISFKESVKLLLYRFIIIEFPPLLLILLTPAMSDYFITIMLRRFFGSMSFSILIFFVVINLINRELLRERQISFDMVSQLPNRRGLQKDLEEADEISAAKSMTMVLITIDNFTSLVRELGYNWADKFLKKTGDIISGETEEDWLRPFQGQVYFFSEHSLGLLLKGLTMADMKASGLGVTLHDKILEGWEDVRGGLRVRLSIGIFDVRPEHMQDPDRLLRNISMLTSPSNSGGVQYFQPEVASQLEDNAKIRQQINIWIANLEAPMWLQPKVHLANGRCEGAEALLRFVPDQTAMGYVNPSRILSVAIEHHLLYELEWATLTTIVRMISQMPPSLSALKISANLSPASLSQPGLGARLSTLLAQYNLPGHRLTIEVTETGGLSANDQVAAENVAQLTQAGVGLSLDDFGTAYSSLSLLSLFPFDELKLDYSMISIMEKPRVHDAIMMTIEGAKRYQASVVAEGIETSEQRQKLLSMGVTKGQGYLFGKAMRPSEFINYALKRL